MQAPSKPQLPAELEVEALRSFTDHQRKVVEKGSRVKLPRVFALELIAANKVKKIDPAPAPAAPVEQAKVAPEKPSAAAKKEK